MYVSCEQPYAQTTETHLCTSCHHKRHWFVRVEIKEVHLTMNTLSDHLCCRQIQVHIIWKLRCWQGQMSLEIYGFNPRHFLLRLRHNTSTPSLTYLSDVILDILITWTDGKNFTHIYLRYIFTCHVQIPVYSQLGQSSLVVCWWQR